MRPLTSSTKVIFSELPVSVSLWVSTRRISSSSILAEPRFPRSTSTDWPANVTSSRQVRRTNRWPRWTPIFFFFSFVFRPLVVGIIYVCERNSLECFRMVSKFYNYVCLLSHWKLIIWRLLYTGLTFNKLDTEIILQGRKRKIFNDFFSLNFICAKLSFNLFNPPTLENYCL